MLLLPKKIKDIYAKKRCIFRLKYEISYFYNIEIISSLLIK